MIFSKIKKKIKKGIVGVLAALTMASAVAVPAMTEEVYAETTGAFTDNDVYKALKDLTGVDLSHNANWTSRYLSQPMYGYGVDRGTAGVSEVINDSIPPSLTYDCVAFAYAVLARSVKYAGKNPADYVKGINYPKDFPSASINGAKTYTDVSNAEPGDIIEYAGTMGHLDVVLGWKDGQLWTIGGSSTGYGPIIQQYTGTSGSGGYTATFYRLYHFDHTPPTKEVTATVNKTSADVAFTGDNDEYSLNNAQFKVYAGNSTADADYLTTITTDANGKASVKVTVAQSVYQLTFVETVAPEGYKLYESPLVATISNGTATCYVEEEPNRAEIEVELNKSSSNPDITDGNDCYSLAGAVYQISYMDHHNQEVILGNITTDANGYASATYENLPLGITKLYAKEITAAKNYDLDSETHSVEVADEKAVFNVTDAPLNDPAAIVITKTDADGKTNVSDLSGAEFTLKYYDTLDANSAADVANLTPTRTWVIKTVKKTLANGIVYRAALDDPDCFVSGDELFKNSFGMETIPYGVLTIQETKAADGYTINGGSVNSSGQTISAGADDIVFFKVDATDAIEKLTYDNPMVKNEEAIRGNFEIQKHDAETGSTEVQGTTTFAGTTYDFYYVDSVVQPNSGVSVTFDANNDGVMEEYHPGDKIKTITLDSNGYAKVEDLETGTYKLVETSATPGYSNLDANGNPREYTFDIVEDGKTITVDSENTPLFANVQLYKHYNDKAGSEVDDVPEEGAEFVVILKSKVDSDYNGDAYAAAEAVKNGNSTFTKHEGVVATTNARGIAKFNDIAIGDYYLVQTYGDPEAELLGEPYEFSVYEEDLDGADPIVLSVTNDWKDYIIEFNKYDSKTLAKITSTSASFKIKNIETGEYLTQTVAGKTYDTFRTASSNDPETPERFYIIPDATEEDYGTVRTPLALKAGEYMIEEVETPDGYVTGENFQISVNVNEVGRIITTSEGKQQSVKVVTVKNTPVEGRLEISKEALLADADVQLIDEVDYTEITYELRAKEDIISPADGSVIAYAGEVAKDRLGNTIGNIRLSSDGTAVVENIPMGTYELVETSTYPGLALDTESYEVVFESVDNVTPIVVQTIALKNYETETEFSKTDITGDEEIPGAQMQIVAEDGTVVAEWTSTETATKIAGIPEGSYKLRETIAPEGFVLRTSEVEFTVEGHEVSSVEMSNKTFEFSKVDAGGEEIEGALMQVIDEDGNIVDEWISGLEPHKIENLVEGGTYRIHEEVAADGYVKATDIEITVTSDYSENQHAEMTDKIMSVSKVDLGGDEIEGAILTVTDEDGNVVDQWTSTNEEHRVNGLEVGKTYTLSEDTAPLGYIKATDITFEVLDDGINQHLEMTDLIERVEKLDDEGNMISGAVMTAVDEDGNVVDEWTTGENIIEFTDEQKEAILALEDGESYEFAVDENTAAKVTAFVDEDGNRSYELMIIASYAVDYASMAMEEPEIDNEPVEILTAAYYYDIDENGNETTHRVSHLEYGKSYEIVEKQSPEGYYFAPSVDFEAGENDENGSITMMDQMIRYAIEKVDENGAPVEGVTLKLTDVTTDTDGNYIRTDENGEPMEIELPNGGVTTGEAIELDGVLEAGHEYRLEETEWAGGLYKATDIYFNVNIYGDTETPVITITMVDALAKVTVNKVDAKGNPLAGAKMQILEAVEASEDEDDAVIEEPTEETVEEVIPSEEEEILDEEAVVMALDDDSAEDEEVIDEEEKPSEIEEIEASEPEYVPAEDEDGNVKVVYEFESTDEVGGVDISEYVKGDTTYILREVEAPYGYNVIEDMTFTVTGTSDSYQVIYAIDTPKQYDVEVLKVDEDDHTKVLEGAEFYLMNSETDKIVRDITGEPCVGTTDKNGKLSFTVAYNDSMKGYYLMEKKAPTDYTLDTTKHYVELDEDYTFENAMEYTITNKKDDMGVSAPVKAIVGGSAALIALGTMVVTGKRKKDNEAE